MRTGHLSHTDLFGTVSRPGSRQVHKINAGYEQNKKRDDRENGYIRNIAMGGIELVI
jgi:hypothetical protein